MKKFWHKIGTLDFLNIENNAEKSKIRLCRMIPKTAEYAVFVGICKEKAVYHCISEYGSVAETVGFEHAENTDSYGVSANYWHDFGTIVLKNQKSMVI